MKPQVLPLDASGTTERLALVPISQIRPSPENDQLYARPDPESPAFTALVDSIRTHGIREPLVITSDHVLVSGHRRLAAAKASVADRKARVPCRILGKARTDYSADEWTVLLREHNRSRVKTFDEVLREEIVSTDPEAAFEALLEERKVRRLPQVGHVPLRGRKERKAISDAKDEFVAGVQDVLTGMRFAEFLPISLRRVHYLLLNRPPLTHGSKPDSRYRNTPADYKKLSDLVLRMRLEGLIDWEDISDDTRPQRLWRTHTDVGSFIRDEFKGLFSGYWRDLLRTQPDHVELVVEKNTVEGVLASVAQQYTMPVTSGRGYCSGRPRYDLAQRFRASGKKRLVLLLVSDHDPDGDEISHSFARSLRDEFDVPAVEAFRVALTPAQVKRFSLVPGGKAKEGSSSFDRYVSEHGTDDIYELEALPPVNLQAELTDAIERVLDLDLLNVEIALEKQEAGELKARKSAILKTLKEGGGE